MFASWQHAVYKSTFLTDLQKVRVTKTGFRVNTTLNSWMDSGEVHDLNKHLVQILSAWDHLNSCMPSTECLHILPMCDNEDP